MAGERSQQIRTRGLRRACRRRAMSEGRRLTKAYGAMTFTGDDSDQGRKSACAGGRWKVSQGRQLEAGRQGGWMLGITESLR